MNKIDKYRALDAVNYSLLKRVIEGNPTRSGFKGRSLDLGSLVDCKLTTPNLFNDMFTVIDKIPGPKPKAIVDHIFSDFESNVDAQVVSLELLDENYLAALINQYEYWGGIKDKEGDRENKIAKLISDTDVVDYYTERSSILTSSKSVVDKDLLIQADMLATSIQQGRFTSCFFYLPNGVVMHTQVIVTFTVSGVQCKAMVDVLIENTTDKPVMLGAYMLPGKCVLPIDIKTTKERTTSFQKAMWKYKYYLQGALYRHGVSQWVAYNKPGLNVADFIFVVESTTSPGKPLSWTLSKEDEMIGRWGAKRTDNGYQCALGVDDNPDLIASTLDLDILGFEQAIQLWKWHSENDEWDYPQYVIENNGLLTTKMF